MVETIGPRRSDLVLRPFAPADFEELQDWFRSEDEARLWGGPLVHFPVDDAQLALMFAETVGANPRRRCWSAFAGRDLVGHAQAVREDETSVRLARVAVAPDRRRRGIGRAIVSSVIEEILSDRSVKQVTLNVYSENDDACRLYREVGFGPAGPARSSSVPESRSMLLPRSRWSSALSGI